jgi:hypothetical protein
VYTQKMKKIVGVTVFVLVIIVLGIWYAKIVRQSLRMETRRVVPVGESCGGNMLTARVCFAGYHCAPVPGSNLPFGDVGGTCVPD